MNRASVSSQKPLAAALIAALGLVPPAAQAATITVTTNTDSGSGSLRAAIASAGTGDTINFSTSAFPVNGTNTITLSSGQLSIGVSSLTIDATANGNVTLNAAHASGVINDNAASGGSLTLKGLTIENGTLTQYATTCKNLPLGAGICIPYANLSLSNDTISGNTAYVAGGGIYSDTGTVTVANSTISGNSTGGIGGGIETFNGKLTVTYSTISGNTATLGGGIYARDSAVNITNSTISGNTGNGGGGGIYSKAKVTLNYVTMSNNTAGGGAFGAHPGGGMDGPGSGTATSSIIAGNNQSGGDVNLTGGFTAYTSIQTTTNLHLGSLQKNGGPTQTMLPGVGSTAIDGVPGASCSSATDQRGVTRPRGSACDIGAVEVSQYLLTVMVSGSGSVSVNPTPQSGSIAGCTGTCTAYFLGEGTGTPITVTLSTTAKNVTWGGDCSAAGTNPTATVSMSAARTCTAATSMPVTLQSFEVD